MKIFRQFRKNLSLRMVNLIGLSIMLTCLLLSAGYVKRELSYDRHHTNANRIVRMTLQFDNNSVDGRLYGNGVYDALQQIPEIERITQMSKINTAVLTYSGTNCVVNDFYRVNKDFLQTFDIPLLQGAKDESLSRNGQVLLSESIAQQLFGDIDYNELQLLEININGQQFSGNVFVSGIFDDIPETSHFHTDILLHLPEDEDVYAFTYLLLQNRTDINALAQKITKVVEEKELYQSSDVRVHLMPLTDIHLHSHNLREMTINGNIYYIYLVIGANALLLIVVLFNLWLNTSLIFSHNRRYYQILRICGASTSEVFKDEALLALFYGMLSIIIGVLAAYCISSFGFIFTQISVMDIVAICLLFLLLVIAVSLLPSLRSISYTLFLKTNIDLKPIRFSYANVKWMLTVQYAVVMIIVILAFGINKQMNLVKDTQVGGNEQNILVLANQPEQVKARYDLLKTELLKHTGIEAVTSSFQLPGDAIRDNIGVRKEDDEDWIPLPIMVVEEDFLQFFHINMIAGRDFLPGKYDYPTEEAMMFERLFNQNFSEHIEEYIINRKALAILGFSTPEEAIGEMLRIVHGSLDYFRGGIIVGVTDDFNYTGLYEETIPMLILQRRMFQHCIMVRLAPDHFMQARTVFEDVWKKVNPEYPASYVFMNDVFGRVYNNEMNAQQLVYIFSLLCFVIADLGLIIFMAFIIRKRTKEIGIRKVHGASVGNILLMLNMNFIRYIALAFLIAVPIAWYIMYSWLERFAYRTSLDWWIFALAGLSVLLILIVSVSVQSWRAASANPVKAIAKS